ncbi:hypothetical protein RA268_27800, partial [Pseudomonas syringae pv. tagetis]
MVVVGVGCFGGVCGGDGVGFLGGWVGWVCRCFWGFGGFVVGVGVCVGFVIWVVGWGVGGGGLDLGCLVTVKAWRLGLKVYLHCSDAA